MSGISSGSGPRSSPSSPSRVARASVSALIKASAGAEVVLPAGTYREQLVLDGPVVLSAAGGTGSVRFEVERGPVVIVRGSAVLRGLVFQVADTSLPVVYADGGTARFSRCVFRGSRVETSGSAAPVFHQCEFRESELAGLYAIGASRPRLEECAFIDMPGHAVVGAESAVITAVKSRIERPGGAGIRVIAGARAVLEGCRVVGSRDPALVVAEAASLVARGCEFRGSATEGVKIDGSAPFAASGPGGVLLEECLIAESALEGLVVGAGTVRLDRVEVAQSRRSGVLVGGTAAVEARACSVLDTEVTGVVVRGGARLRAERMKVLRCGANAVVLGQDAAVDLVEGEYGDTGASVVHAAGDSLLVAQGSLFRTTREHGVVVRDAAVAVLETCTVRECALDAVRLEGRADATLLNCRMEGARTGVVLATCQRPILESCVAAVTVGAGIVLGDGCAAVLLDCAVEHMGGSGIVLADRSAAYADRIRITDAAADGMAIGSGAAPRVRHVRIADVGGVGLRFGRDARGVFEDWEVSGGSGPLDLGEGATPQLMRLPEIDPDTAAPDEGAREQAARR